MDLERFSSLSREEILEDRRASSPLGLPHPGRHRTCGIDAALGRGLSRQSSRGGRHRIGGSFSSLLSIVSLRHR
mgnify:CR=1 FL=1